MIKHLALIAAGVLSLHTAAARKYVDASTLTLIGRTCPMEGNPYYRVDTARYHFDNAAIRRYCGYPAGVAVLFTTDSRSIEARWTTTPRSYGWNMTPVMQRGMDLYIRRDGIWTMAGAARPGLEDRHSGTIVEHMDRQPRECMLYLPTWSELLTLEIGVDDDAVVTPLASPYKHRVIVFGSSITHGASASRPGMAYPAQLERATGFEFVNLGASGQCKMEQFFAHVAAACEADAFLFDSFSNPSAQQIEERLEPFVATIRAAHPTTPLIFLQTEVRESRNFNDKIRKFEDDKRAASEAGMQRLLKQDKNIYFLNPGMPLGDDHDATVDGVHPSDLGHGRILEVIRPQIVKILKKHDIR